MITKPFIRNGVSNEYLAYCFCQSVACRQLLATVQEKKPTFSSMDLWIKASVIQEVWTQAHSTGLFYSRSCISLEGWALASGTTLGNNILLQGFLVFWWYQIRSRLLNVPMTDFGDVQTLMYNPLPKSAFDLLIFRILVLSTGSCPLLCNARYQAPILCSY